MIERIQLILKTKNLSPSQFADEIKVQRSGVSHILSGRNNPSLDFITKVLKTYPEIDADWLLFGKGQMTTKLTHPVVSVPKNEIPFPPTDEVRPEEKLIAEKTAIKPPEVKKIESMPLPGDIEKIIVFYTDHKFVEFLPKE